jgi:hypothetical protein
MPCSAPRSTPWCTSRPSRRSANRRPAAGLLRATTSAACSRCAEAMQRHGCKTLVFSSSATVYGDPQQLPIRETRRSSATNPYGADQADGETTSCATWRADPQWQTPAALLQPGRRARERPDRRRPARHAEQPDALRRAGGRRPPATPAGVRQRLRHARRHRRARLHPRRRPGRRPCRGAARCWTAPARSPSTSAPAGPQRARARCARSSAPAAARAGTTSRRAGPATSPRAMPTRRWPSACSAGGATRDLARCAPTAGAGRPIRG